MCYRVSKHIEYPKRNPSSKRLSTINIADYAY